MASATTDDDRSRSPDLVFAIVTGSALIGSVVTAISSHAVWRDDPDRDGAGAHRGGSEA